MNDLSSRATQTVDVSAIVVTYNRNAALRRTLEGLINQNPAPCEILVIDQSESHDQSTQQFLDEAIEREQIKYFFQAEPNAQRARNRAIGEARGSVLLFIDDDVVMDENLVAAHWKNYADPNLGAVCGFFTEPGDTPLDTLPLTCKDKRFGWIYFPHAYTKRVECHLLPAGNGSIRRHVARQLGGFDENYTYTHFDDTDLSCRLKAMGIKSIHDPEARLVHLKEMAGGKRPGGLNDYVIADSNRWYVWCYFFWMNFRWQGRYEVVQRLRGCVFRRKNITKPWYLGLALLHFIKGATRAAIAIRGGRRLGSFSLTDSEPKEPQIADAVTGFIGG